MAEGVMVPTPIRSDDEYGLATHIERINPGDNPAHIRGMSPGLAERGPVAETPKPSSKPG